MYMEDTPQPPQEDNTPLMKPKRTRKLTEEQSKAQAERMRKVNEERIEKARLASQDALALQEQKLKAKLDKVESKKQVVKKLKEDKNMTEPESEPKVEKRDYKEPPLKKQRARRIVVQESSDSEDYYEGQTDNESDEDEEVIYVTKSKPREKKQTITKAKKEKYIPVRTPIEVPKTYVKFF